eukprot:CAMPEP_0170375118 /NCGR_PEP_ID=MMETSP0117_2-20130122/10992_1 /TAXON_ID=400756 /ORGANISM="Durinskia baltica, Strain CSIRO CS-38" /LENGTH=264 /DNA_ID=CAMNT_0010630175 /DNA_START=27 /DNA_END=819 /DNA_ORIENTATION=+
MSAMCAPRLGAGHAGKYRSRAPVADSLWWRPLSALHRHIRRTDRRRAQPGARSLAKVVELQLVHWEALAVEDGLRHAESTDASRLLIKALHLFKLLPAVTDEGLHVVVLLVDEKADDLFEEAASKLALLADAARRHHLDGADVVDVARVPAGLLRALPLIGVLRRRARMRLQCALLLAVRGVRGHRGRAATAAKAMSKRRAAAMFQFRMSVHTPEGGFAKAPATVFGQSGQGDEQAERRRHVPVSVLAAPGAATAEGESSAKGS